MVEPPSLAGGDQVTTMSLPLRLAITAIGAVGGADGMMAELAREVGELPTSFVATTLKV
jgi:hypothetical protein